MSIDEQQIRAIAFLAARCRPTGATPWDEPGIVANLRKVAHIDAAEVIMATVRAAGSRDAKSPGVIPNLGGEHWREKVSERSPAHPPKRDETCSVPGHEGYRRDNCAGCNTERLAGDAPPTDRAPADPTTKTTALAMCRAALTASEAAS